MGLRTAFIRGSLPLEGLNYKINNFKTEFYDHMAIFFLQNRIFILLKLSFPKKRVQLQKI